MLPAQSGVRPALGPDPRRPAGGPRHAHGQGRGLLRLQGRPQATTWPPTPTTRRRRTITQRQRHRRRRRPRDGHLDRRTSPPTSRVDYGRTAALGSQAADSARVTDHSIELTGLSPSTTYRFRVTLGRRRGQRGSSPAAAAPRPSARRPARSWTTAPPSSRARHAEQHLRGRERSPAPTARCCSSPTVGEEFDGAALPARLERAARGVSGGEVEDRRRRARRGRGLHLHDPDSTTVRASSSSAPPSGRSTTRPSASATTSATSPTRSSARAPAADPFQMYAQSGGGPGHRAG